MVHDRRTYSLAHLNIILGKKFRKEICNSEVIWRKKLLHIHGYIEFLPEIKEITKNMILRISMMPDVYKSLNHTSIQPFYVIQDCIIWLFWFNRFCLCSIHGWIACKRSDYQLQHIEPQLSVMSMNTVIDRCACTNAVTKNHYRERSNSQSRLKQL